MTEPLDNSDAIDLIRQTATLDTIIVGGQAVTVWALHYGLVPKTLALSGDIDYVGIARDAIAA